MSKTCREELAFDSFAGVGQAFETLVSELGSSIAVGICLGIGLVDNCDWHHAGAVNSPHLN